MVRAMRVLLLCALAACSATSSIAADASGDADGALADGGTTPHIWGERCGDTGSGNGLDDDGDGLVDEDCIGLFAGVYAPAVAGDPALAAIEGASGRPLAVLQTYHSMSAAGVARIAPDLAAIFARGQVAHLNIEPAGYTAAQYAAPSTDPIAHDLDAVAHAITTAVAGAQDGRVILTFGAEMNGNWTDWGCLPAPQYIALYRAAHDHVISALAAANIDPRRVRWAYGPNATSSASCGSAAGYYPGHAYVDLLGMSAYRTASDSVDASVIAPMTALFDALAYPEAWRRDRFVVLQTGSRAATDRDAWISALFDKLATDERAAGIIYFDAADWAAPAASLGPRLAAAPVADRGLDGIFTPSFWDVPYNHPAFHEIQALRDLGITTGCAASPPRFCPDEPVRAIEAGALVERAFPGAHVSFSDPVSEVDLASALVSLGAEAPAVDDVTATRARAAILIAHSVIPGT